jgi:16S rRNA (cytosine1402-N4)-methyltransferase
MQLDQPERGFSFMSDGPLDMRMGREGPTAAEIVNELSEAELARILFTLGEERKGRSIARAIVNERREKPITSTRELAQLVERVVGRSNEKIHPATRTFQALRIHVNDELREIELALDAAERLLRPGGRLVVVAFHSLEDRIVKRFLAERTGKAGRPSRHAPVAAAGHAPTFEPITKGAVMPTAEEIEANPRARSAKLRAAMRSTATARGERGGA